MHLSCRFVSYVRIQRFVVGVSSGWAVPRGIDWQAVSTGVGWAHDAKLNKVSINISIRHTGCFIRHLIKLRR